MTKEKPSIGEEIEEWLRTQNKNAESAHAVTHEGDISEKARYDHARRLIRDFIAIFDQLPETEEARKRQERYNAGVTVSLQRDKLTRLSLKDGRWAFGHFKTPVNEVLYVRRRTITGAIEDIGDELARERAGDIIGARPGVMGVWTPKFDYWAEMLDLLTSKVRNGLKTHTSGEVGYYSPDIYEDTLEGGKRAVSNKPSVVRKGYALVAQLRHDIA